MYLAHSAREDTVIYPAFHQLAPPELFAELGEKFEAIEQQHFGQEGFENILKQVEQIEKALGIYDMPRYQAIIPPGK